jgi:NAD(P)-dependent dehydrogenase (short-subunit alcohol dehydrogenase family)
MKTIVITGSTRGLGLGLARAFLDLGQAVVISGRTESACDGAVRGLQAHFPADRILAQPCDVRDPARLQALWEAAQRRFGQVDIWINNAGVSAPPSQVWSLPAGETRSVIETNLLGVMYGTRVAMQGMLAQGFGAIYNMEGMGSDGRKHDGLAAYGASKYAIHYYNECLAQETRQTPILAGALRPGMVATDLITSPYKGRPQEWRRVKRIFNIIADTVENVAPWLAQRMLDNRQNGAVLSYSSSLKLLGRFLTSPLSKRDLFKDFEP